MTTREEYAEAATLCEMQARMQWEMTASKQQYALAARVLRALADGAVLVRPECKLCPPLQVCDLCQGTGGKDVDPQP